MGIQRQIPRALLLALWAGLLAPSAAEALDQTAAQDEAKRIHDQGSDDSLHESYGNALHAVHNFFQLNLPGAVSYGLKAYGQYRNSNQLDALRDRNAHLAGSMASAGAPPSGASAVTGGTYVSPYQRLDTKFLYEGSTGVVAAKLEKLSGLSRERMFHMAVDLHARSKSLSDPDFAPWALKSYRELTAKVPNEEFRDKLTRFGDLAEKAVRSGFAQTVLAQFQAVDKGSAPTMVAGPAPAAPEEKALDAAPADPAPARSVAAVAAAKDDTGLSESLRFSARGSATTGVDRSKRGLDRLEFEPVDGFLGDLMHARGDEGEGSLFRVVSAKIREVSGRQNLERRPGAPQPVAIAAVGDL
jgi:hypothetical protein